MKFRIKTTSRFEKEVKICQKRGYNMFILREVMTMLAEGEELPPKFKKHKLIGNYKDCWECHLKPDWLLIWQQNDSELVLLFMNTGTHSDLF